jgi:pimeloyl-ACP methyl ester carboxylesterase
VGRFLEVDGVRLHVLDRGEGPPLVLLHGNGTMIEDFVSSGLVDLAAQSRRVLAFDRPGFGHSSRPRTTIWTPAAQADLLAAALDGLGVSGAIVLGHSWGCAVAVELGRKRPDLVHGLVLASGYYYPTARVDVPALAAPAVPVVGDILRYTVSPLLARAMWPLTKRAMFGPTSVPESFAGVPKEMIFRPSQIGAGAAESALMVPNAAAAAPYSDLRMPVAIIAGEKDRVVGIEAQSARLHAELPQSTFHAVSGAGHMVHQIAPRAVMQAIERCAMSVSAANTVELDSAA